MNNPMNPQPTNGNWQATLPEEWTIPYVDDSGREQQIPLRDHPSLRHYKTKDEAVKALVHAQRMLGKTGSLWNDLGLDQGAPVRVLKMVGNYGEIFDRNLGPNTPLRMERGLNALWTQGGLLYAPPFR